MKRLSLLAALVLVSACGTEPTPVTAESTTAPIAAPAAAAAPASMATALRVDQVDALPPCEALNDGALAYVAADKQFRVCLEGQWQVVDLRGAQGKPGTDGTPGAPGANGAQGPQGEQGKPGTDGAQGAAGANAVGVGVVWQDPDGGQRWQVASEAAAYAEAAGVCGAGWSVPSGALPPKFSQFLAQYLATLPSSGSYWTTFAVGDGTQRTRSLELDGATAADVDPAELHFVICEGL